MSTVSTDAIYKLLVTRLLTYVDLDGNTLTQAIASRLWRLSPPDNLTPAEYPFGVISIKSPQNGNAGLVLTADVEVLFFARPRGQQAPIEALGDRALSALITYRVGDTTNGLLWFEDATVQSLPTFPAPADPDVVQVRVMAKLHCYPLLLTRLST